jgi:hypothetical protein
MENLGMKKVCAKMASKNITYSQLNRGGREIHADLLQQIENNKWLNIVITGDKSWVFQWQSMQWKSPAIPHPSNVWLSK